MSPRPPRPLRQPLYGRLPWLWLPPPPPRPPPPRHPLPLCPPVKSEILCFRLVVIFVALISN